MLDDKYLELLKKSKDAKEKNIGLIFKKFFNDNEIPKWQEILDFIYSQYFYNKEVNLEYQLYITSLPDNQNNKDYFPQLSNFKKYLGCHLNGPKISIGPFYIGSHKDSFDGFTVHCEGKNQWTLSDKDLKYDTPEYIETFDLERGDLLFCPAGLFHSIKSSNARASILYIADLK